MSGIGLFREQTHQGTAAVRLDCKCSITPATVRNDPKATILSFSLTTERAESKACAGVSHSVIERCGATAIPASRSRSRSAEAGVPRGPGNVARCQ